MTSIGGSGTPVTGLALLNSFSLLFKSKSTSMTTPTIPREVPNCFRIRLFKAISLNSIQAKSGHGLKPGYSLKSTLTLSSRNLIPYFLFP
ncbi:MAG: hypothetical protein KA133_01750 [Flavobacterium sp.]|nr:hypothetical protein [Flavobacterium sp.]